jgi:cation diffusion facilitator CzcD-associated flavoprotein CzcO
VSRDDVDVLIVGAGLSGIDAAYHLQTTLPGLSYAIVEARAAMGGTWDLFRYPGIRSDSDMYTLGFPFRPWPTARGIAGGADILAYLRDTASHYGIDRHIRYRHRVDRAAWDSATAKWTVHASNPDTGARHAITCRFLFLAAVYFHYDHGFTPELPGRASFAGRVVHPQAWTPDIATANKRVVVIGSGATAVTLVPALAATAAHVTMLQRSPTYIMSRPAEDPATAWLRRNLPAGTAAELARWKSVLLTTAFYAYCRRFPDRAKQMLVDGVAAQLRDPEAAAAHFTPSYKPWDQRLCLVPDGDLFGAIRSGRAEVVTDHVDTFTPRGIQLRSGRHLDADVIVTATGLRLRAFGGADLVVDGRPVKLPDVMTYKGMMCSDVPNLAFAIGYTNASWTLKCDLTSRFVCRVLTHMQRHGKRVVVARRDPGVARAPIIDFTSTYVARYIDQFPSQGAVAPWRLYQNYAFDLASLKYARLEDRALQFT